MDFFAAQDQARRRSQLLTALFGLAIVGVVLIIYLPIGYMLGGGGLDPTLLASVAVPVAGVILGASWWRLRSLRAGGPQVALLLGGRQVLPNTESPQERQLLNLVEEMALASGTPVPPVFVLDREEGINAFAAGYSIHDAAIAVTRGCLDRLDRDELQGVIAHEFSHILNGDMRLNIRMVGLLFGLLVLTVIGRGLLRSTAFRSGRRNDVAAAVVAAGLVLMVVGYLGIFFGKLIKSALSREREYLADAAAVQFTRNPDGIAGALKKIGGLFPGSRVEDHHAEELSHLFFASGMRERFFTVFQTHPPIEARIHRVDPRWDGSFDVEVPESVLEAARPARDRPRADGGAADRGPAAGGPGPRGLAPASDAPAPGTSRPTMLDSGPLTPTGAGHDVLRPLGLPALAALATLGAPSAVHLDHARDLLDRIPDRLRDAAHDETGARALICALLLDPEPGTARSRQLRYVAGYGGAELAARVEALAASVTEAGADARLALLDLALPTLRSMTEAEAGDLRRTAQRLIKADGAVRMFDYALVHILARHLPPGRDEAAGVGGRIHSLQPLRAEVAMVLSALAHSGAEEAGDAGSAFAAALGRLPEPLRNLTLEPEATVDLTAVDAALRQLERAAMPVRKRLVDACLHCVAADGRLLPAEAEGLRAVAEALDCPLPPIVSGAAERVTA